MKVFISLPGLLAAIITLSSCSKKSLDVQPEIDLGTFSQAESKSFSLAIRNSNWFYPNETVNIHGSCSCTEIEPKSLTLQPRQTKVVHITVGGSGRLGTFSTTLALKTASGQIRQVKVNAFVFPMSGMIVDPPSIALKIDSAGNCAPKMLLVTLDSDQLNDLNYNAKDASIVIRKVGVENIANTRLSRVSFEVAPAVGTNAFEIYSEVRFYIGRETTKIPVVAREMNSKPKAPAIVFLGSIHRGISKNFTIRDVQFDVSAISATTYGASVRKLNQNEDVLKLEWDCKSCPVGLYSDVLTLKDAGALRKANVALTGYVED